MSKTPMVSRATALRICLVGVIILALYQACTDGSSTVSENASVLKVERIHDPRPAECASCHLGSQAPAPRFFADHVPTDARDCAFCHNPGSWKGGDFGLDGPGHPVRANSCMACHEFERPAVANFPDGQGPQKDHFNGLDCLNCHAPPNPTFVFKHANALGAEVGFCLPCHDSIGRAAHVDRPDVEFSGSGNCQTCHNSASSWRNLK